MTSAAAVIACALALLGRSEAKMPPIVLVDAVPKHASIQAEAFVSWPDPTIYVVTSSPVFREAMSSRAECGNSLALKKLASILAHEEWHIKHGRDERGAYQAQLTTLLLIGVPPDNALYTSVVRSMAVVLKKKKDKKPDKPDMVLARADDTLLRVPLGDATQARTVTSSAQSPRATTVPMIALSR